MNPLQQPFQTHQGLQVSLNPKRCLMGMTQVHLQETPVASPSFRAETAEACCVFWAYNWCCGGQSQQRYKQ
jgi:hypothetical protein